MTTTLEAADLLRESAPAEALKAYAALQGQIEADDSERILWICDQVAPTPPSTLLPLFDRVQANGPALLGRAALHAAATCAWYEGRGDEAERMWTQGMRADECDRYWIRSCLNLAMVMQLRQCLFEPLVLSGMGCSAGQAIDAPYLVAYAALRRTELLLKMGAIERADEPLEIAARAHERVEAPHQRKVIDYEWIRVNAHFHEARGDRKAALEAHDQELALLEARPEGSVEAAVWIATLMSRLDLRYAEYPEEREAILEAYDELPTRFAFGPYWQAHWERHRTERFLQHAIEQGAHETARDLAHKLLALIREDPADSRRVLSAARLGKVLARDLDDAETSKQAYEIASHACLNRIVEADRASREIPELAEATPQDWEALRTYRGQLATKQQELLQSVAENLKPGAAAFDLIVRDDAIRVCAWCSRVHTSGGVWQPLMHYVPDQPAQMLTHGICEDCRGRLLPDEPTC